MRGCDKPLTGAALHAAGAEILERRVTRIVAYMDMGFTCEDAGAMREVVEDGEQFGELYRLGALERFKETKGMEELERSVGWTEPSRPAFGNKEGAPIELNPIVNRSPLTAEQWLTSHKKHRPPRYD